MENKKDLIKDYTKRIGYMAVVAALTFGVIFTFEALGSDDSGLPENFPRAYREASEQNTELVKLTNSVNQKIEKINEMDLEGNSEESLKLIKEAEEENSRAKTKAEELSGTLEDLRSMLGKTGDSQKSKVAQEAIIIETKLVRSFMDYTESLDEFLGALNKAVTTDSFSDRLSVEQRLEKVNRKKRAISELNQELINKIEELSAN